MRIRREDQLPVYERLGDVRAKAVTMGQIADILRERGELDEALRILRKDELPEAPSRAEYDSHVSEVRLAMGRTDALADVLQRYYDVRCGDPDVVERRVSHLIDLTAEAAVQAMEALDRAGDSLGKRRVRQSVAPIVADVAGGTRRVSRTAAD